MAIKKKAVPAVEVSGEKTDEQVTVAFLEAVGGVVLGRTSISDLHKIIRALIEEVPDPSSKARGYRVALLRYTLGQTRSILDHGNSFLY